MRIPHYISIDLLNVSVVEFYILLVLIEVLVVLVFAMVIGQDT